MNNGSRSVIRNEMMMPSGVRMAVSRIIDRLMPSTPMVKLLLICGSHGIENTNLNPPLSTGAF